MKKIKEKFKAFYDEKKYPLNIHEFISFEMALTVVHHFKKEANSKKGYIMFTKYHIVNQKIENPNKDSYLLQNASVLLKKYRSQKVWMDTLAEYQKKEFKGIRLFDICGEEILEKVSSNLPYPNRKSEYINYLLCNEGIKDDYKPNYAQVGIYEYEDSSEKFKKNLISFDEMPTNLQRYPLMIDKVSQKGKYREKIEVKIEDLLDAAKLMQQKIPNDSCFSILIKNIIKRVEDGKVAVTDRLEIDKVVNIVGMVGAGKTTLLKVLAYLLEQRKKKMVLVVDTVSDVFDLYQYFQNLECSCSPLIGKSDRMKYINQLMEKDAYYLKENFSKYLTTNCLIDGMNLENKNVPIWGKEPCMRLKNNNKNYICPYFDFCPTTAMEREALKSNIVITTVAGFALISVGNSHRLFLKHVIENVDLVFFDECDRVQKKLDQMFTPAISFNDFIKDSSFLHRENFMNQSNAQRIKHRSMIDYYELIGKSPIVIICVFEAVKAVQERSSNDFYDTFSSYTILNEIEDDILKDTKEQLYELLDFGKNKKGILYEIMKATCESLSTIHKEELEDKFSSWIEEQEPQLSVKEINQRLKSNLSKQEERSLEKEKQRRLLLQRKILLILTLIYFDHFIMEIGVAYEKAYDFDISNNKLINFIKTRFKKQQDYLPSSLMGNLFGIKIAKEDDILLFRQYAYGRSLLTDLPYLRVNEEGSPIGPHVLLLSGSSYAKGSYEYHVNAKINYIIEADTSVRNFISKTEFRECHLERRVSGSPLDKKEQILKDIVEDIFEYIIFELDHKDGKILLVVNSFIQADIVASKLKQLLQKARRKEEVLALIPDSNTEKADNKSYIKRGEISKFDKKKARILVAPALSIERGHNIVDEMGHSSLSSLFFMIRPMGVPDDIMAKSIKMNGYIAEKLYEYNNKKNDIYEKNLYVRKEAIQFWKRIHNASKMNLDYLSDQEIKTDLIATMFVLILQIFGRLCRITDTSKQPPTIYFVDGAFRRRQEDGFDVLNEFHLYLDKMFSEKTSAQVAKTLYEPFYTAYKGGIDYE